jgi:hypothetical protein
MPIVVQIVNYTAVGKYFSRDLSMTVSPGSLDSLVGTQYAANDLTSVAVQSATANGSSVVLTTTGAYALGGAPGETYTVAAVNDTDNSITFSDNVGAGLILQETFYVVGYSSSGLLVTDFSPPASTFSLVSSEGPSAVNGILGVLSASPIPAETAITFTNPGTTPLGPTPGSFTVQDQTTDTTTTVAGTPYTGPVAGLTSEYVTNTSDILNITAQTPNSFIEIAPLPGGAQPTEAGINVSAVNGNNVLDAYANSNFYTGGTGTDQFYEDTRTLTGNSWSTVVNFHSSDNITLWGVTAADFTPDWIGDTYGAAGATGLTGVLVPTTAGQPEAAVTLAGFKMADLTDGKLTLTYGQTATTNGVAGSTYLSIHAN